MNLARRISFLTSLSGFYADQRISVLLRLFTTPSHEGKALVENLDSQNSSSHDSISQSVSENRSDSPLLLLPAFSSSEDQAPAENLNSQSSDPRDSISLSVSENHPDRTELIFDRTVDREPRRRRVDRSVVAQELLVGRDTDPRSLAVSLATALRTYGRCQVLAAGDEAVSQFVKGAAVARMFLQERQEGDLCFQASHLFWLDRNSSNQLNFTVVRNPDTLTISQSMQRIRVRRETDMRALSKSIKTALSKHEMVDIQSIGPCATACSVVASTWTRRMSLAVRKDVDCYPLLWRPTGEETRAERFHIVSLILTERPAAADLSDSASSALTPIQFHTAIDQLCSPEDAFSECVDVDLPIVKIGAETHPNKAATALIGFLRSCGGVQIFSSGGTANNQALKAITVCRSYVQELRGYDVGFQCMHAPRDNRNGECQVVTWLRLIADTSKKLFALDATKVQFRIGNLNDAKSVGKSMAAHIEHAQRLECTSIGIGAGARSLIAISHARLLLAAKQLDLVALPLFDDGSVAFDFQERKFVRLRLDILAIKKKPQS